MKRTDRLFTVLRENGKVVDLVQGRMDPDAEVVDVLDLVREVQSLRKRLDQAESVQEGSYWSWDSEGGNDIDSLSCPVVMEPDQIRDLMSRRFKVEYILCAALYIDNGSDKPARRSHAYPRTGMMLCAWRHGDCYVPLQTITDRLTPEERDEYDSTLEYCLGGRYQGFLTSTGRFVDRKEAADIAYNAGQIAEPLPMLTSENLY